MRRTIRNDILFFGIPALLVFFSGLVVSGLDGYEGLANTLWGILTNPEGIHALSPWNLAGLLLFVFGISLAIVSALTLKRHYAPTLITREDHQLVTRGVYRHVRHPLYLGVLIAIFGAPAYGPSLRGFLILSLLIPIFLLRIKMEEAMLLEHFGSEYLEYQRRTRKLVPFLY